MKKGGVIRRVTGIDQGDRFSQLSLPKTQLSLNRGHSSKRSPIRRTPTPRKFGRKIHSPGITGSSLVVPASAAIGRFKP